MAQLARGSNTSGKRRSSCKPLRILSARVRLHDTDDAALKCVKEANGIVRMEIEATLSTELANSPMAGADIRVSSGNFITAKPLGVIDGVDYMHTGVVRRVDVEGIKRSLDDDEVVLISPIGFSPTGDIFNCTLEDVATSVAIALKADKLIFLTETMGATDSKEKLLTALTAVEAQEALNAVRYGGQTEDIRLFLPCAIRAVREGVKRAHLVSRHVDGALLMEMFTPHGIGTMVVKEAADNLRDATLADVDGILAIIDPLVERGVLVARSRFTRIPAVTSGSMMPMMPSASVSFASRRQSGASSTIMVPMP